MLKFGRKPGWLCGLVLGNEGIGVTWGTEEELPEFEEDGSNSLKFGRGSFWIVT